MLAGNDLGHGERLVLLDRGYPAFLVGVLPGIVPPLLIDPQEAVEGEGGAVGPEACAPVFRGDVDGDLIECGARHLARHRTLPDQVVEPGLVPVQGA